MKNSKEWAAKRDSDGHIVMIRCSGDPQALLDQMSDGPYTLMSEITDTNPTPSSRFFRNQWKDNGSGDVEVDLTAARDMKKTECRSARDEKLTKSDTDWVEKSSKSESLTATETYKTDLRNLGTTIDSDIDAETDLAALETYAPSWPTDPNS